MQTVNGNFRPEVKKQRVVIVGAGASGIGAARTLITAGIKPIILEANSRIGGRLFMHQLSQNLLNDNKTSSEVTIQLGMC